MTIAPNDFTHLHVHSEFSLLDGLGRIDDLTSEAARLGFDSLAITDHGALYGGVRVCNPFIAQVQESPPAPYAVERASPHRPRGRPRKVA